MWQISPPEPISDSHITGSFDCGKPVLNNWLKHRALSNHLNGFTAVMVVHREQQVMGFYGLAPTTILPTSLPRKVRTGQPPDPIPCLLLGQLAVDQSCKGTGVGMGLLKHALLRSIAAAKLVAGRAVIVRAVDEDAAQFWRRNGFLPTREDEMILYRSMADIAQNI